ncbi:MAG: ERAP1-like C-terminal domain-containing protein [Gemmatimonadaceae bacterium]|nr:ERAP1-like C-terminal domain-containing protein [Gemmatimonadaceae bacterium]
MGAGVSRALAGARRTQIADVRYDLSLDVTRRDTASGRVTVAFQRMAGGDIVLDFRGLAVDSLRVNGGAVPMTRTVWNGAHIAIDAARLTAGDNRVTVDFRSPIAAAGASIIRAHDATDNQDYLYTLLVPSDANLLFPCFDQPDLKARVTLSLVTPRPWRALANGAAVRRDSTVATTTHHFAETAPLSTYLVAFAAGPWTVTSKSEQITEGAATTPVALWTRRSRAPEAETDSLIAMNARALRWLGHWFGIPYAFGKFDFLLAPAFPFGGMEHPGAVFYNEESFIYRERPTVTQLLGRQATVYHEVAHQWFGDYMTMRWFDDLWLKEGFATYMAAKMQASLDPTSNAWKTFYLRNKPVAYGTDATAGTTPVWQQLANLDQAKSNYGPIVYNKAPGILRQLNYLVGDRAFQSGVQQFLRSHAYGNATWQDLLADIGRASGRDLAPWGRAWILRPGMPVVEQHVTLRAGRIARLTLTQRPAQPALSGRGAWPLKMQVLLAYADGRMVRLPVEMSTASMEVVAARGRAAPDFVFANDGDFGYALVLPDSGSVEWLERHVGAVRDDFLRALLWGAMWDLVRDARLAPERFVAMTLREIPRESDEQLVGSLIGRMSTAITRYASDAGRDSLLPQAEAMALAGAADTARAYGPRKNFLDASIGLARTSASLARLDGWLDRDSILGLPLRPPTRWAIVTRLVARAAPSAEARLSAESRRDSTSDGRRLAFVAGAARPDSAQKRALFTRWFADASLNEEWVTSSLRAFHDPEHATWTRPYLEAALDTLPWIQRNRRIFFLGSWIGAVFGGQNSAEALQAVDRWLAAQSSLPADLRQKVLQSRDELERTVSIRGRYAKRALQ